jgi:hypothetical protein
MEQMIQTLKKHGTFPYKYLGIAAAQATHRTPASIKRIIRKR